MIDMMNNGQGGWMMDGGMWPYSILLWILIITGIVFIIQWLTERNRNVSSSTESALDVLKKRYAGGEIDRDTFEQMKRDIERSIP